MSFINRITKVQKLEKKKNELINTQMQVDKLQNEYLTELETNTKYSLDVDPENKYNMSDEQKLFVSNYVQYKSILAVSEFTGIEIERCKEYFVSYSSQQEIRRINLALYQRQFATRLISLDEIGGYLTSLLTDNNVALADQLKTNDKLRVAQMLIDLNKLKMSGIQDPSLIMSANIDVQLKNLSVATIEQLLSQDKKMQDSNKIIDIMPNKLTPEESAYISSLPASDLLEIIEETNKKGGK